MKAHKRSNRPHWGKQKTYVGLATTHTHACSHTHNKTAACSHGSKDAVHSDADMNM